MPASKLSIGGAIYGRGWSGVPSTNNGLYQTFAGVLKGTWDDGSSGLTGVLDYKDLTSRIATGQLIRYWDDAAHAPYAYSADSKTLVSYDDVQSIADKSAYIKIN